MSYMFGGTDSKIRLNSHPYILSQLLAIECLHHHIELAYPSNLNLNYQMKNTLGLLVQ